MCVFSHSAMSDSVTLWTVAPQTALSMEFSGQECSLFFDIHVLWASLVPQLVKNPPAMQETPV